MTPPNWGQVPRGQVSIKGRVMNRRMSRVNPAHSSRRETNKRMSGMKIITISGAHSGVGKTTLAEMLFKKLKKWSALKITVSHTGFCPKGKPCGACDDLKAKFCIVSDEKIITEAGKDTARFKASGAEKALWLRAKPEGLKEGLRKVIPRFKGAKGILIEGTSVLKYLDPDLAIFVKKKDSVLKPSAKSALKKMDLIIDL